ncbi:MAG: DUF6259 domain-containing protein, partial [Armatimonadota bacterium]|nr:DUF6259 domain-containing protein [Armatimonadota bacterium]
RVSLYRGDWRVPAQRYRQWAEANLRPVRVTHQEPSWVRHVRCCVITGMSIPVIEALAGRLDPAQTLLYIPSWRKAGYDRDYPTYDQPLAELGPFLARAHQLGYRVMLHVNYFGCDPLNPLYPQFEPFQVRSPWGAHEKQWWTWPADPPIRFAYINPAHRGWRDLFVARMRQLCSEFPVDALHLDQTLCIFNDHNGRIDNMNMVEGNVALHRELREALPHVALSGEGLNEVTYRYEAFAQRHAYGLRHAEGTWDRALLRMAHPISSYLLRPYTIVYGYLGCAAPTQAQLYAAWNEVYQHLGVIPTLKPSLEQVRNPTGFTRQFFDEVKAWQENRLEIDTEGPWPATVSFPYRTANGQRAVRTSDRRLLVGTREVSRTVTDVSEVRGPGSIPGWFAYDGKRIFGLNPDAWYPYFADARDPNVFHVEELPRGIVPAMVAENPGMAVVRTRPAEGSALSDLVAMLDRAQCGSRPFEG